MGSELSSPWRYPGAKSRLADKILHYAEPVREYTRFVDVFVGGGSVSMAFVNLSGGDVELIVNDIDVGVSAFWQCVFDTALRTRLIELILRTVPTVDEHAIQREKANADDVVERGFSAFFLNRTSFSGILSSGPIGGQNQKSKYGVGCRYNPVVLAGKTHKIGVALEGRVTVSNKDFGDVIPVFDDYGTLIYCDSNYYVKGNGLYRNAMDDQCHVRLRDCLRDVKKAVFVASYDNAPRIRELYGDFADILELPVRYSIQGERRKSWNSNVELVIRSAR